MANLTDTCGGISCYDGWDQVQNKLLIFSILNVIYALPYPLSVGNCLRCSSVLFDGKNPGVLIQFELKVMVL